MGEMSEYHHIPEDEFHGPDYTVWKSKDGRTTPIANLAVPHMHNILKKLEKGEFDMSEQERSEWTKIIIEAIALKEEKEDK